MRKKLAIICSMRLAGYLMLHGFRLVKIEPDKKNPLMNIYLFYDSDLLWDAVDKYTLERQAKLHQDEAV